MWKVVDKNSIKILLRRGDMRLESLMSLPWFLEYMTRGYRVPIFYAFSEGIVIPIVLIRKGFLKIAYVPSPPNIIRYSPKLTLNSLREVEKAMGFHVLVMRQFPYDKLVESKSNGNYILIKDRADLFLDLRNEMCIIYSNFEKRFRYTLRKSLGLKDQELLKRFDEDPYLGGIVYEENNEKGVETFSELLKYQFGKIASETNRKNNNELLRLYSYYHINNIKSVYNILGEEGLIRFFFSKIDGKPEAFVALFVSKKYLYSPMAYWWLGASTRSAERKALPNILQFSIINVLKKEHYERYFLGGVGKDFRQASTGPNLFKKSLGGHFRQGHLLIHIRGLPFSKFELLSNIKIFGAIRQLTNL